MPCRGAVWYARLPAKRRCSGNAKWQKRVGPPCFGPRVNNAGPGTDRCGPVPLIAWRVVQRSEAVGPRRTRIGSLHGQAAEAKPRSRQATKGEERKKDDDAMGRPSLLRGWTCAAFGMGCGPGPRAEGPDQVLPQKSQEDAKGRQCRQRMERAPSRSPLFRILSFFAATTVAFGSTAPSASTPPRVQRSSAGWS